MSEEIKAMNVYQRMHGVMSEINNVTKNGYNDFQKYRFAKESDFVEAIKPLLTKYRLMILPDVVVMVHAPEKPALIDIKMTFTIVNIDNPTDKVVASMGGQGADNGDKAIYKAISGTKKYFYAVTFAISTGDDPEENSSNDKNPEKKEQAAPPKTSSFQKEAVAPAKEKKESNDGW